MDIPQKLTKTLNFFPQEITIKTNARSWVYIVRYNLNIHRKWQKRLIETNAHSLGCHLSVDT
jgi:hypothetical protein